MFVSKISEIRFSKDSLSRLSGRSIWFLSVLTTMTIFLSGIWLNVDIEESLNSLEALTFSLVFFKNFAPLFDSVLCLLLPYCIDAISFSF